MNRFLSELRTTESPVAAAELGRRGVSHHQLAGRRWRQTSRGFHRPAAPVEVTPTSRILDVAATLPAGAMIAGWAAAFALGVDHLDGFDDFSLRPIPVPVILPPGLHRRRGRDARYVQRWSEAATPQPLDVVEIGGVRISGPVRTAFDLARSAANLTEAVVAIDAMLGAAVVGQRTLAAASAGFRGTRGVRQARRALELACPGVLSPWESRLRMFHVLDLLLPTPLVNRPVFDANGRLLGVPDLLDEEAGLVIEYDGGRWRSLTRAAGHRDEAQHREDNVREELFERAGLVVVRCDKHDLTRQRPRLAARLRAARADGLARDRSRDRWSVEPSENEVVRGA
jgi:hypothetical protein